jgi:hypothetical protein
MSDQPFEDPIVAEIHAIRSQLLAESGGDLQVLIERIRARQQQAGRRVRPAPPQIPPVVDTLQAPEQPECQLRVLPLSSEPDRCRRL